ncbi:MAG: OsmC family protein [Candidatus Nanohaloarchaea archaeon]|nr:OsmC family protein [Candidatus Nanohaloarchaea archaeon]
MVEYPLQFQASAVAAGNEEVWIASAEQGGEITVSGAEEFGGSPDGISPEELFALSIANCIVSTFRAIAERKDLSHEAVAADITATLDRTGEEGRPAITRAEVEVTLEGVEDRELAREIGEITDRNCFVSRSVKTEVETSYRFS